MSDADDPRPIRRRPAVVDAGRHEAVVADLTRELRAREHVLQAVYASRSWRVTAPLRMLKEAGGVSRALQRLLGRRRSTPGSALALAPADSLYACRASDPPGVVMPRLRVLIVAELGLAQCARYRVWQKQRGFERLGIACDVVSWTDHAAVRDALQTHSLAIFYRVPGYPETLAAMAEARRLGVPTLWEADDLIFDEVAYRANGNLATLTPELRESVLAGVPLYRRALQACDGAIASTEHLAAAMRAAGAGEVFVVENGLDDDTVEQAAALAAARGPRDDRVTILYGSGSLAHDADFAQAADGVLAVMRASPEARLRIVGTLQLPPGFEAVADRVERLPPVDYASYLALLAEADISLAPLEATAFNDAKSNIKWLEAAVLGLPSLCSPRAAFAGAITAEVDGLLAETGEDWSRALATLVQDAGLRRRMGRAARETALARYAPSVVAGRQLSPIVARFAPARSQALRVLVVNVHWAPQSFGGATIVAEEVARRLNARDDVDVVAFTTWGDVSAEPYTIVRYEAHGVPAIAIKLLTPVEPPLDYRNARMEAAFGDVLEAVRPDVVHFHAVQGLSASTMQACLNAGIPYVVTLHDSWWICERQFMVRPEGRYCHQRRIDWSVCATCVGDLGASMRRAAWLRPLLDGAAHLLTPSAFHRGLHLDNGVDPARISVNRNGVARPRAARTARREGDPVRFGFVGGIGPIKGLDLIRRVFEGLDATNWELVLVDNTTNLGFSSLRVDDWRVKGRVTVTPAYTQSTMDAFFDRIDVLLFPSQWKESFGLTVREALVRDVWVIVTDAGGAVEDVVDGENGDVIPLGDDIGPLQAAVLNRLRRPERLSGYVNPYKARVATYEAQADDLFDMLRTVVARAGPAER